MRKHRVARSLSERCRIILRCGEGVPSKVVADELGVHEHTVGKWRRRFLKDRLDGLLDEVRPGRPRTIDDDQIAAVIERTLRSTTSDRPIGRSARWQGPQAFRTRRSAGYGTLSACSRIAQRRSSFPAILCSSTSASWINQVERWFAELTRKQLRRGVHTSTMQLEADIRSFIERHNQNPKPYRWTKSADDILASVKRFCQKVQDL